MKIIGGPSMGLLSVLILWAMSTPAFGGQTSVKTPAPLKLEVVATPFIARDGGGFQQMLRVTVDNPGEETRGEVRARLGSAEIRLPLEKIQGGISEHPLFIPEVTADIAASFTLRAGRRTASVEKTLSPPRHWSIYLFHHSHTDIGYTELQTRIFKKHAEYLDDVVNYCRETEDYPDDAKFRWNIEISWALQNYMKHRPEKKVKELLDLVRQGRVEVGAWYLQLSDMFAHDELIRAVDFAAELGKKYGLPIRSAMNDDVTGWSWASPQVLSRAGVRYFATGINETRSRAPLRRPNAFYWESPDGSRILHWNGEHYLLANYAFRLHEGVEKSSPLVEKYLRDLEARGDYPYDLIAFNVGARVTDNSPPGRKLSDIVRDWNERWAFPKLRLAVMREFFEAFEDKYGAKIPTHKLGWPDYWTDGIASSAFESGINRLAHSELLTAEKAGAVASVLDSGFTYPAAELREGQELSMFFDEHTWGAHNSIDNPDSELARGQWALKSGFAYKAREIAQTLIRKNLEALAGRLQPPKEAGLIVFNPLSWSRTDVVRAVLPDSLIEKKQPFHLTDRRTGREDAFQFLDERTILFLARDVPSLGYVVFEISPGAGTVPAGAPVPEQGITATQNLALENDSYRLTVDPGTGGINSLFDKKLQAECVDGASPYTLDQYIYENPEGGRKAVDDMGNRAAFKRWSPTSARVLAGMNGPIARSLRVEAEAPGCRTIKSEIFLYDGINRVDLTNRLDKEDTRIPEAVYFSFPFKVDGGSFLFEIADGAMRPEVDQLPGTTRDWLTVQHWVEAANSERAVVWSPVEAPLVEFGDINTGKWLKKLDIRNSEVFSYAMNNYWMTNFKASQGGVVTFRYSITSRAGGSDSAKSGRFGWEVHTPLQTAWIPAESGGEETAASRSFLEVDSPNVVVQAVKMAEDGKGLIVRLREMAGQSTEARLKSVFLEGTGVAAQLVDTEWAEGKPVEVTNGIAVVPLPAFGIRTLRIVRPR
jgi:alpha-mannosidase